MSFEQGVEIIAGYRQHLVGTIVRLEANGVQIIRECIIDLLGQPQPVSCADDLRCVIGRCKRYVLFLRAPSYTW